MSIGDNLKQVKERISAAALRAGRRSEEVALIAVTKTVGAEKIAEAVAAGVTDIGENYVQDALAKHASIGGSVRWHMIGHLQTNKVRHAVRVFDLIQAVDSVKLAEEIGKRSLAEGRTTDILIEVNISGEESKFGVPPDQALDLACELSGIAGVRMQGLMGIAPFVDDRAVIRQSFAGLRSLWEGLASQQQVWLSMGMTGDFEIAIEEGSNMVRIGTAIFGPRV